MPVYTRTNGNALQVVSVGPNYGNTASANDSVNLAISTGIGKPIQCFSINCNVALEGNLGTGQAVEKILSTIGSNATILAYGIGNSPDHGNPNNMLSVIVEESIWSLDPTTGAGNLRAGAGNLQQQINSLGTISGFNYADVVVTSPGLNFLEGNVDPGYSASVP